MQDSVPVCTLGTMNIGSSPSLLLHGLFLVNHLMKFHSILSCKIISTGANTFVLSAQQ